ncbi:MAG: 1,4-dihydroxy-2-naphthoate octaprenyltransferase [Chlorobi bacterium]|nr:1,4-dihydroxy-2-naphthoate octaprenyltransferase [Chlorobiota bacterium]
MNKTKVWISAMRLRTLPLSLAGIVLGSGLAAARGQCDLRIFILALLTAASYQILSNLANDYGDGIKGTDARRKGPARAVAAGRISPESMKKALVVNILISLLLTLALLKAAFGWLDDVFWLYFLMGLGAIWAAVRYTVGRSAYGYKGLGDLFVLIFFGWVSVAGVYFLHTRSLEPGVWAAGTAIGLLAVAVLNINNTRDLETDRAAGKRTLAVMMGKANAVKYQRALLILSFLFMVYATLEFYVTPFQWAVLWLYIPLFRHLKIMRGDDPEAFNRALKQVSLGTFVLALAYACVLTLAV